MIVSISFMQCGEAIHRVVKIANLDYAMDYIMNEVSRKLATKVGISISQTDSDKIRRKFKKAARKYLSIDHPRTYSRPLGPWISFVWNKYIVPNYENIQQIEKIYKQYYDKTNYTIKLGQ